LKLLTTFYPKPTGYSICRFKFKITSSFPFMRLCLLVEFLTEWQTLLNTPYPSPPPPSLVMVGKGKNHQDETITPS
jgi:hypothetical protein